MHINSHGATGAQDQSGISPAQYLRALDPTHAKQQRHVDRQFEENMRQLAKRPDQSADVEKMLAEFGDDNSSGRSDQSTLTDHAAPKAEDDEGTLLPPRWRERREALVTYMRGDGPAQAGLRQTGKPAICYTLIGWLIEDWTRKYGKEPSLADIAATIGTIKRSAAQNLRDQVRGFLKPGGLWKPTVSGNKGAAVSVTRAKRSTDPNQRSSCADGDFLHDHWRSGGIEAIDRRATSVVETNRRFIPLGRKRPPVYLRRSPPTRPPEPPKDDFNALDPRLQVIIAYGAMTMREGVVINGLTYGCYSLTGKIHTTAETRVRRQTIPIAYLRKRCVDEIARAYNRHKLPKAGIEIILTLEQDSRGQWHVHGAVTCPVDHKKLVENAIDVALGKWRHDGKNQRGHKPVLLKRAVTVRAIGYAVKPESYISGSSAPQIAITRGLVREAKGFYREAVTAVLQYRATGKRLISGATKPLKRRRRDREFWRKHWRRQNELSIDCVDPEFDRLCNLAPEALQREIEGLKRELAIEKAKTPMSTGPSGRPLGITGAAISGDMAAAITAERAMLD